MKRGYTYTIVFMLVVSAVFTFFLAGTDALTSDRIEANAQTEEMRAVLYAFDLDSTGEFDELRARFENLIEPVETEELSYYQHVEGGEVLGYAVPFTNSGLWGTIRGWLAVTPDLTEVQGLVFTEQNETPGLGGRITEQWFTDQFRGLRLDTDTPLTYGTQGDLEIDAITGATSTSNAVLRILNDVRDEVLPLVEVN